MLQMLEMVSTLESFILMLIKQTFLIYLSMYQGLFLVRQVLYHLNYAPALFFFIYFDGAVLYFCPGLVSDGDPPTYGLLHDWDHS
jgi:hypothetical protein